MKYCWVFFLLAFSSIATCDTSLLPILAERNRSINILQGTFEQTKNITSLPVPLISSGVFSFNRTNTEMTWATQEPLQSIMLLENNVIYVDGKKLPAQQQNGAAFVSKIFMTVIGGDLSGISEFFHVTATGTEDRWTLSLAPQSSNIANYIQSIVLLGGEYTEEITIAETNGDQTRIRLSTSNVEKFKKPQL